MEAIILAGGLGTRLNSRLTDLPKAMAPVAGRPFLSILLDQMLNAGCTRVILSVGHLRHVIMGAFGESYHGIPLTYAVEETPLGTGGAIRLALRHVREASALVLNGDTYIDLDFRAMHAAHGAAAGVMTMAVTSVPNVARYGGVVVEEDRVTGFIEKGSTGSGWINAGAYLLARDFPWPEGLAERFSFETGVLVPFVGRLQPRAWKHEGYFLDIGIPEDLDRAQAELAGSRRFAK